MYGADEPVPARLPVTVVTDAVDARRRVRRNLPLNRDVRARRSVGTQLLRSQRYFVSQSQSLATVTQDVPDLRCTWRKVPWRAQVVLRVAAPERDAHRLARACSEARALVTTLPKLTHSSLSSNTTPVCSVVWSLRRSRGRGARGHRGAVAQRHRQLRRPPAAPPRAATARSAWRRPRSPASRTPRAWPGSPRRRWRGRR